MKGLELNVTKQNGMTLVEYQLGAADVYDDSQTRLHSSEILFRSSTRTRMEREVLSLMCIMTLLWK